MPARTTKDQDNKPLLQFNARISYNLRQKLDAYLDYMNEPLRQRPPETETWPTTITAVIDEAISEYLAERPLRYRKGPRPDQLKKKGKE